MPEQRTLDELKRMSRDEVHAAFRAGELDTLMGRTPASNGSATERTDAEGNSLPLTVENLKAMTPDEIVAARKAGQLDHLLAQRTVGGSRKSSDRQRRA